MLLMRESNMSFGFFFFQLQFLVSLFFLCTPSPCEWLASYINLRYKQYLLKIELLIFEGKGKLGTEETEKECLLT